MCGLLFIFYIVAFVLAAAGSDGHPGRFAGILFLNACVASVVYLALLFVVGF